MSANDRNEAFFDKNEAFDDGSEGELSQDELNNVSGGLRAAMKDQQPDGRMAFGPDGRVSGKTDGQASFDPSDAAAR